MLADKTNSCQTVTVVTAVPMMPGAGPGSLQLTVIFFQFSKMLGLSLFSIMIFVVSTTITAIVSIYLDKSLPVLDWNPFPHQVFTMALYSLTRTSHGLFSGIFLVLGCSARVQNFRKSSFVRSMQRLLIKEAS